VRSVVLNPDVICFLLFSALNYPRFRRVPG
jgi:hypothetical protein